MTMQTPPEEDLRRRITVDPKIFGGKPRTSKHASFTLVAWSDTIPKMALSVGFTRFVFSTDATRATGLLSLAPVGLTPSPKLHPH